MRVLILGNGINIFLDPALIFGIGPFPELGLTGAAVATTIGRGVGCLFALSLLAKGSGHLAVRRAHVRLEPGTMWSIAALSGWGTFQVALGSMSWMGLVRVVSGFGSTAMAGHNRDPHCSLLMPALASHAATMVGQSLGASCRIARSSRWTAARFNMLFGLTGVLFLVFAPISSVVHGGRRGEDGRRMGCGRSARFSTVRAWHGAEQSFNGAGDTQTPTWINFFCF
jgi:Na+-driven multidrug efflux pump